MHNKSTAMASKPSTISPLLPVILLVICSLGASAHNITNILDQFSDFTKLNNLLTQTQVASDINSRTSITVLAVNDGALSSVSGQPMDVVKKILQVHVVLDYYDADKLKSISGHSAMLATLFQATGQASAQNGFLNVSDMSNGQVAFGSAAPGSRLSADFVQVLVTHPYNISVVQVGSVIIPPGIGAVPSGSLTAPTPSPAASAGAPNVAPIPAALAPKLAPVPTMAPVPAAAVSPKTAPPAVSTPPTGASSPATDEMPPAPSNDASDDALPTAPSSEPPSPPAPPGSFSTAPAGGPSYIAGAPGPVAGDEGPLSATGRVVVGSGAYVVAIVAALLAAGLL